MLSYVIFPLSNIDIFLFEYIEYIEYWIYKHVKFFRNVYVSSIIKH